METRAPPGLGTSRLLPPTVLETRGPLCQRPSLSPGTRPPPCLPRTTAFPSPPAVWARGVSRRHDHPHGGPPRPELSAGLRAPSVDLFLCLRFSVPRAGCRAALRLAVGVLLSPSSGRAVAELWHSCVRDHFWCHRDEQRTPGPSTRPGVELSPCVSVQLVQTAETPALPLGSGAAVTRATSVEKGFGVDWEDFPPRH